MLGRIGGREITTTIPPSLLVACDSALLGQALINLVENALEYSPPGAALHVEARCAPAPAIRARPGTVEIDVSDSGHGVPDAEKTRIFEKFYRAHAHEGATWGSGSPSREGS